MKTKDKRYWGGAGRHQRIYDALYKVLVPGMGPCETVEGELLRAVSKLYYRYFNDGDTCRRHHDENPANTAWNYLWQMHGEFANVLNLLRNATSRREYEGALEDLVDQTVMWVHKKRGRFTPNTDDYLNY